MLNLTRNLLQFLTLIWRDHQFQIFIYVGLNLIFNWMISFGNLMLRLVEVHAVLCLL